MMCERNGFADYRGGPAGLGVAAGLRAGVLAQPVTLGSQGRLVTTGGPHGALHLVLQVPVAAVRTDKAKKRQLLSMRHKRSMPLEFDHQLQEHLWLRCSNTLNQPCSYLLTGPRSQISAFRKGTKEEPQNGQEEFRLESSDVQPAMISSS